MSIAPERYRAAASVDYEDVSLYSPSLGQGGMHLSLPTTTFCSRTFSNLEDEKIWTRRWVAVGPAAQIPDAGDLLPRTVGNHGLHVERQQDGTLIARFNKAQHGGCRFIPRQCQTGSKTSCSYTSCGYSRDESAISYKELSDPNRRLGQYVGHNPSKLLPASVMEIAGQLFVHVEPGKSWTGHQKQQTITSLLSGWVVAPFTTHEAQWNANWKLVMAAWIRDGAQLCLPESDDEAVSNKLAVYPNLCVETHKSGAFVHVLQQVAMTATRVITYCLGSEEASLKLNDLRLSCEAEQARLDSLHAASMAHGRMECFSYEHCNEEPYPEARALYRWLVEDLVCQYPHESTEVIYLDPGFSARRN